MENIKEEYIIVKKEDKKEEYIIEKKDEEELLIKEKIEKILRQIDLTKEEAEKRLIENNYDEIKVIKNYLGIDKNKSSNIKSVNQEIYKQIRKHLDNSMSDYRNRNIKKLDI